MEDKKTYKKGFFAFFTFLTGIVLLGVLLGTLSCCLSDKGFLESLDALGGDFLEKRKSQNFGQILASSLASGSLFLAAIFLCGFSPLGQVLEGAILLFRGMGLGTVLSQLYISGGKQMIPFSCLLFVPGAVVATVAMIFGARDAVSLSTIYLKTTLCERNCEGLLPSVKIYVAKFLVLEAVLSVSAGIDCGCTLFLIGKF